MALVVRMTGFPLDSFSPYTFYCQGFDMEAKRFRLLILYFIPVYIIYSSSCNFSG